METDNKPVLAGQMAKRLQENITSKSQTTSTASSPKSEPRGQSDHWVGLERAYVAGIFAKFAELYGHIWSSQTATAEKTESKMRSWAQVLAGVEPKEVGAALKRLPEKPPSAPQFRALCKQDAPACAAHRPFPKALPKPPPDPEVAKAAIAEMRRILAGGKPEKPADGALSPPGEPF